MNLNGKWKFSNPNWDLAAGTVVTLDGEPVKNVLAYRVEGGIGTKGYPDFTKLTLVLQVSDIEVEVLANAKAASK